MKTVFLSLIAILGLIVLGGLGWLAFSRADIDQTSFEQEIQPVPIAAPAPAPVNSVAPLPAPIAVPEIDADANATPVDAVETPAETPAALDDSAE